MKERLLVLGALVGVVGVAGYVLWGGDEPPTGRAIGTGTTGEPGETPALWKALSKYESNHLRTWRGAFSNEAPAPMEVLEAWNELGYSITGQGGFWRKTVPDNWLDCPSSPGAPACKALQKAKPEIDGWDRFQKEIEGLSDAKAARFLEQNQEKMLGYLERFVPAEPSASGMEATGFFQEKLQGELTADPAAAIGADDDL